MNLNAVKRAPSFEGGSQEGAVLTVPNVLTAVRMLMALVAAALFVTSGVGALGVALCVLALCLDGLDGWYARRYGQCSALGGFLDPLADKLVIGVMFGAIAVEAQSLIVWVLYALILLREAGITLSRFNYLRRFGRSYPSNKLGKVKMLIQSVAGTAILSYVCLGERPFDSIHYPIIVLTGVIAISCYLSAYFYVFPRSVRKVLLRRELEVGKWSSDGRALDGALRREDRRPAVHS